MYFLSRFNSFFEIFFYVQWVIQSVFEIGDAFGRAKIDTQNVYFRIFRLFLSYDQTPKTFFPIFEFIKVQKFNEFINLRCSKNITCLLSGSVILRTFLSSHQKVCKQTIYRHICNVFSGIIIKKQRITFEKICSLQKTAAPVFKLTLRARLQ